LLAHAVQGLLEVLLSAGRVLCRGGAVSLDLLPYFGQLRAHTLDLLRELICVETADPGKLLCESGSLGSQGGELRLKGGILSGEASGLATCLFSFCLDLFAPTETSYCRAAAGVDG
jgi:hypothetical protein